MKPVEYWICAIRADEPECWDGPYRTVEGAFTAKDRGFRTPDFEVYEVTAKKVTRPKPNPPPKPPRLEIERPKVRTTSVRPKAERTPRSKGRR